MTGAGTVRTPFRVHCAVCEHAWDAAYLPMEVDTFATILSAAHCPKCGADARFVRCGNPQPAPPPANMEESA